MHAQKAGAMTVHWLCMDASLLMAYGGLQALQYVCIIPATEVLAALTW